MEPYIIIIIVVACLLVIALVAFFVISYNKKKKIAESEAEVNEKVTDKSRKSACNWSKNCSYKCKQAILD